MGRASGGSRPEMTELSLTDYKTVWPSVLRERRQAPKHVRQQETREEEDRETELTTNLYKLPKQCPLRDKCVCLFQNLFQRVKFQDISGQTQCRCHVTASLGNWEVTETETNSVSVRDCAAHYKTY